MEPVTPKRQTRRPNNGNKTGKDDDSQGAKGTKHLRVQADKEHEVRRARKEREDGAGSRGRGREGSSDFRRKKEKPVDRVGRGREFRKDGSDADKKGQRRGETGARGRDGPSEKQKRLVQVEKTGAEVKQGARRKIPGMTARTGQSVDGRGRNQDFRRFRSTERSMGNGPRSQSTGGDKNPRGSRLGYKALEELAEQEPSVVAVALSSHPGLKEHLCATEMRPDLVDLLCLVLCKAFQSQGEKGSLFHLAGLIKKSAFFRTILPLFLVDMGSEFNSVPWAKHPKNLEHILVIISKVLNTFPASSLKAVTLVMTVLQSSMNTLRASGVDIPSHVTETQKELQILVNKLQERSRTGTLGSDTYSILTAGGDDSGEEDQRDFRSISIYPPPEEFQDHTPFLRPNLISQRYINTHIYLDTHFRLLREDYVKPLRDAVQQLVSLKTVNGMTDETLKGKKFDDVLVYFDAKLVGIECTHNGLAYIVQFDIQPLKSLRWQNSKRLLYGSLVCLSCDNFQSLLFATVSDRELKDLQKGRIQVVFTEESRLRLAGSQNQVFLMVESPAYFEAYRYVLEGLQEQREYDLPFQKYIVECNTDVRPPNYLKGRDTYDLSHIAASPKAKKKMQPFRCLQPEAWPRMQDLGLDESQMKAVHLALTKELAIIQGPPGCGKTHVGLKIAQALLTNQHLWRDESGRSTILVVCYTNHALDQFLEGIHKFLKKGIVRVGGQSNSESLKALNLKAIRSSDKFRRSLPDYLRTAFREIYTEKEKEEKQIQNQRQRLRCSQKGILHEKILETLMSSQHWKSLHSPLVVINDGKSSLIIEWLGLDFMVQQRETENTKTNEDSPSEEPMELDEEDVIEIAEEADLIQAERIIEDDTWPKRGKDVRKRRILDSGVRELEEMMLALNLEEAEKKEKTPAGQIDAEWQIQRAQRKKLQHKIKMELQKNSAMTDEEEAAVSDVWTLPLVDRWRLYRLWLGRYRLRIHTEVLACEEPYHSAVERLADVKRHECLYILKKAQVIGMTTTGAAKYRSVLQELGPRLVIVEEAAQVLEAHTITTLSKACQHLILIGDHQQLQPSATVYELAKDFHMEISMFERLVRMGHPFVRLNYQHRMRPDIARLLTPHIYPKLENHPCVYKYENIKGISTNLFFVDHTYPEKSSDGKSHQNLHEAKFLVALCRYLLLQDYKREQITILTTYSGQLQCLRNLMPASQFSGVRVHVVDKYQGEENDIILLSLVRSNNQRKVGFLAIHNRVCVALSRAKKAMYCIGNSETLRSSKLWVNIFQTLKEKAQIGPTLNLYCQNHPYRQIKAAHDEDFKQAPEGGCTLPCQYRLDCGHVCVSVCHPYDPEHKKYICNKACQRILCDLGHKCPLLCFQECQKCMVRVPKIIPQCQHTQKVPCHQNPETFECQEPCQKTLACGHLCQSTCGRECTTMCKELINQVLKCGHTQLDHCFYQTSTMEAVCTTPCGHQLKCGHSCRGTCGKCFQGRYHKACLHECETLLVCSHKSGPCFSSGSPCQRPCENKCAHGRCKKRCGQPCIPCTEPCVWQCAHQRCSKLCHEPCDRPPCNKPCPTTLSCGHPCIGLCGEKCPSKCQTCHAKYFSGGTYPPDAHFVQLEDCGHIIEYTAMDLHMQMDDKEEAIKLKNCPKCGTAIRKNLRYGSLINKTLAEIELTKMQINGNTGDIERYRDALKRQCRVDLQIGQQFVVYYEGLDKCSTANDLWFLQNTMDFQRRVESLRKKAKNMSLNQRARFLGILEKFMGWLNDLQQTFTEQQVYDLQRELQRLILLAVVNVGCHMADKQNLSGIVQREIQELKKVLNQSGHFSRQDEERVMETMQDFKGKHPLLSLEMTDIWKEMTKPSMTTPTELWFRCPKGHVQLSKERRGAVETPRCLVCRSDKFL